MAHSIHRERGDNKSKQTTKHRDGGPRAIRRWLTNHYPTHHEFLPTHPLSHKRTQKQQPTYTRTNGTAEERCRGSEPLLLLASCPDRLLLNANRPSLFLMFFIRRGDLRRSGGLLNVGLHILLPFGLLLSSGSMPGQVATPDDKGGGGGA